MSTDPSARIPEWTIGDRLRKARLSAGFEQAEFATATGITRGTIHNYESDKTSPKRPYLVAWAMATGVSLEWLESGISSSSPTPTPPDGPRKGLDQLTEAKRGRARRTTDGGAATARYLDAA